MFYIRKYADCWAVHDDLTGGSRKLAPDEVTKVKIEFECLQDEMVIIIQTEHIRSISAPKETYQEQEQPDKKILHISDHLKTH